MHKQSIIRRILQCYFVGIALSFVVLLFASWVLSIYVDGVEGLLTARGIRWMCSNIVPNFAAVSLAKRLMEMMALSVLLESGIFRTFRGHISLKQNEHCKLREFQCSSLWGFSLSCFSCLMLFCSVLLAPLVIRRSPKACMDCWSVW